MAPLADILRHTLAGVLVSAGALAMVVAAIGAIRFADLFQRLHAWRAAAIAAPLVLTGLAIESFDLHTAMRLALLAAALAMTGPGLQHLLAHAAHRAGLEPAGRERASRGKRS